jgi:hypothetical protein
MNEMSDYAPEPEHVDLLASVVDEPMTYEKPLRRHTYQEDAIFGHLITGEPIDKFVAEKLYGIGHSSLPSAVSRVARRRNLDIRRSKLRDENEQPYTSYRLVQIPSDQAEEPEMLNTTVPETDIKSATACRFVDSVNVHLEEGDPEIRIVCEGKLFQLRPDQLQYLGVTLNHFANTARKA